jgi:hypothetical protein
MNNAASPAAPAPLGSRGPGSPWKKGSDPLAGSKNADGRYLAEDDDSGGDLNARIVCRALRDGVYRIHATSFNAGSGAFTLTVCEKK